MSARVPSQRVELLPLERSVCEHRPSWATRASVTLGHDDVSVVVALSACQLCGEPVLGVAPPGDDVEPTWYGLRGSSAVLT